MTSVARVLRIVEIGIGFLLPLVLAGPFIAIGLFTGTIMLFLGEGTMFALSLYGVFGFFGLANLLFNQNNMSRQRAKLSTAGVFAGIVPVLWLLGHGLSQLLQLDRGVLFWTTVPIPPAIVGVRRVILLWKNPPPDSS